MTKLVAVVIMAGAKSNPNCAVCRYICGAVHGAEKAQQFEKPLFSLSPALLKVLSSMDQ